MHYPAAVDFTAAGKRICGNSIGVSDRRKLANSQESLRSCRPYSFYITPGFVRLGT
jgi:hypothetical protein